MRKYHFDINIDRKRGNNAGSKATGDCRQILIDNGFTDIQIFLKQRWFLFPVNALVLFSRLLRYAVTIHKNSFIVVQYPLLGINRFFKHFARLLKYKGCTLCAIIHDLDSLRSESDDRKTLSEIDALSTYDAVISHNNAMTQWLVNHGYLGHVEEIGLFDYLAPGDKRSEQETKEEFNEVVYAGALDRGRFLEELAKCDYPFFVNLYGNGFKKSIANTNSKVNWFGSFSPDQIISEVKGDFGLVWDGDSVKEITGLSGQYMRYNTPHKTSLYLAAGLPVIVSKNAAIATFIKTNNVGICVDSLAEISARALNTTAVEYAEMKQNALAIGEKIRRGFYLKSAIKKVEGYLENNKAGK